MLPNDDEYHEQKQSIAHGNLWIEHTIEHYNELSDKNKCLILYSAIPKSYAA